MANFGHLDQGLQRGIVAALLFACFAGWCLQLGGVASLQSCCKDDLTLEDNSIDSLRSYLREVRMAKLNPNVPWPQVQVQKLLLGAVAGLRPLAAKSTRVFTLTPDVECSHYYRYQWVNTAVQLVPILILAVALANKTLRSTRLAVVSLLAVASILGMENAHAFYYVRDFAPDLTLQRGKVFAAGCVITAAVNLALCIVIGVQPEAHIAYVTNDSSPDMHATNKAKLQGQAITA